MMRLLMASDPGFAAAFDRLVGARREPEFRTTLFTGEPVFAFRRLHAGFPLRCRAGGVAER